MKEIPNFEISREHELDEKDFNERIGKYIKDNSGKPISGEKVIEIIHEQEKLRNNYVFLNSEGAKNLIERANAILEEKGFERKGSSWVKKKKE